VPHAATAAVIAPRAVHKRATECYVRGSFDEDSVVSKERNTVKEGKKKPLLTPKERKAQKRAKKAARAAGLG
jgi:hypothetical protein